MDRDSMLTVADVATIERARRARNVRRVGLILLAALVVLSVSGVFDREVKREVSGESFDVTVTHPRFVRPGTEFELQIEVEPADGRLTVLLPVSRIGTFGIEDVWPEPASEAVRDGQLHVTVETSGGPVLFSGRIDPAETPGPHRLEFDIGDVSYSANVWILP